MQPALSQVTTLASSFEADLEDYSAAHVDSVEIWLTKLESYLEKHSIAEARQLLDTHAMRAPVASYQGGLWTPEGAARDEHWQHFARRLRICQELGIGTLVVASDLPADCDTSDIDRLARSLDEAAQLATEHQTRLAFEFRAVSGFANNLQTAAAVVAQVDRPNLGICFDVFEYYLGPSKPDDLGALSAENLFHVQLSDLAGVPRELATDSDRVLPGDGDFLLGPLIDFFRQLPYTGCVSVELMNPQLWQTATRSVAEISITALRQLLGVAVME